MCDITHRLPPRNIPNSQGINPEHKTLKASGRLSLPLNLSAAVDRTPFQDESEFVPGSNGHFPRRGRVTDGGATYSLSTSEAARGSPWKTPEKRSASVAEMVGAE